MDHMECKLVSYLFITHVVFFGFHLSWVKFIFESHSQLLRNCHFGIEAEPNISIRIDGGKQKELKGEWILDLEFARWPETQLQVNANVAAYFVDEEIGNDWDKMKFS